LFACALSLCGAWADAEAEVASTHKTANKPEILLSPLMSPPEMPAAVARQSATKKDVRAVAEIRIRNMLEFLILKVFTRK
jgi:hypothetical protein